MKQHGVILAIQVALLLSAAGLQPTSGQGTPVEFLCQPRWIVGDKASYFATLVIGTGSVGNVIYEYVRTDRLVWRGTVQWPEGLRYPARDAALVKRDQLRPAPAGRYRGGFTNKAVPRPPYEHDDYIDVLTGDFVWAATVASTGAITDISDQRQARRVSNMPIYDLLWPITSMRRVVKTFEYREMTIEVRPESVDLSAPLGRVPSLLVADEFSYRGSRWRREAWYARQFPVAVRRSWKFPTSELTLELMAFEPAPGTATREVLCLSPTSTGLPSLGSLIVRAGLTRGDPARPPRDSTDRFSPAEDIAGYVVFEPLEPLPIGHSVVPQARWLRGDSEIHRWTPGPVSVDPRRDWFWWWSSLPKGENRPGTYLLEWSLGGTVVSRIPFTINEP